MIVIVITAIIIYFILIAWTWKSLGFIETKKKIVFIIVGIILMYGITWIIYQTTENGMNYQKQEIKGTIQNVLVAIFTGINGIAILPQLGKILDKINEDEIKKEQFIKRIAILTIILVLGLIFESGYMRDTQEGILKIYSSNSTRK